jgi:hypothetical protein
MPKALFKSLKYVWVSGQQLQISHHEGDHMPKNSDNRAKHNSKAGGKDKKKFKNKKLKSKSKKPVSRKTGTGS